MAFEPVYSLISPSYPNKLATGQAVVEARLLTGGFTVGKVLSASADVSVKSGEVFTGEVRYTGRANFRVLVLDGDGIFRSLDYVAEFSDKLTGDGITAGTQPILRASVLDTDIVLATENEIKLACVVEVYCIGIVDDSVRCLTGGGDGVYTHDDRLDYSRMTAKGSESISYSDTLSVANFDEILLSEPRCFIIKRSVSTDVVNVEGVIINDFTARSGDAVTSARQETAFTAELSAMGAHDGDTCIVACQLTRSQAELISGESPQIASSYTVDFTFCTFCEDVINPVCDAFSVTHELLISGESVTVPMPVCDDTFFERVEGKVTLDENMPAADRVLAACGQNLSITSAYAGENKLTVEGVASSVIVYSSEDGQKASASIELPFSLTVPAPLREGDIVMACGVVTGVTAKVRRDGELDVKADIAVEYSAVRNEVKYVITDLSLGEERALPTGAVAIHVARKGETLWDAAKALGTTPENVLLQNPGLVLPFSGGERVITYRCLEKK